MSVRKSLANTHNGPSDRIRTCGIMLPKHARYQLRYTRITTIRIISHSERIFKGENTAVTVRGGKRGIPGRPMCREAGKEFRCQT